MELLTTEITELRNRGWFSRENKQERQELLSVMLFALFRILLLCLAAAVGFIAVYIPLMNLFFDKRVPVIYFLIVGVAIFISYQMAKLLDRFLSRRMHGSKET